MGRTGDTRMRRTFAALLGLLIGYPVFAFAGYWAIALFSSNGLIVPSKPA
jgi:hypothetical protein